MEGDNGQENGGEDFPEYLEVIFHELGNELQKLCLWDNGGSIPEEVEELTKDYDEFIEAARERDQRRRAEVMRSLDENMPDHSETGKKGIFEYIINGLESAESYLQLVEMTELTR